MKSMLLPRVETRGVVQRAAECCVLFLCLPQSVAAGLVAAVCTLSLLSQRRKASHFPS